MEKCKECGEEVIEDEENGHKVIVCTSCGVLQTTVQDLTSSNEFQGSSYSDGTGHGPGTKKYWMQTGEKREPRSIKDGENIITNLGRVFRLRDDMISDAISLYQQTFYKHVYRHSSEKKHAMCQACIFVVARQNNRVIYLTDFTIEAANTKSLINRCVSILKIDYNVHLPAADLFADIESILVHKDFSHQMLQLTCDIMKLLDYLWITAGKRRRPFIIVSGFIAWKASNYLERKKKKITFFCKTHGLSIFKLQFQRVNEVYKALKSLVQELPWIRETDDDEIEVEPYLNDVIKYQKTLLQEAIDKYLINISTKNGDDKDEDEENEDTEAEGIHSQIVEEHGNLFRQFSSHKRSSDQAECEDNRKKVRLYNENDDDNSDLEHVLGSDDDTDLYIKSEAEVEITKQLWEKQN